MSELRTALVIDLVGNLQQKARQYTSALGGLSSQGARHLMSLKTAADVSGRALDALGNKYSAILGGGSMALAIRSVGAFETRLTRLGIAGKIGDDGLQRIKKGLFEISQEKGIRVDPTETLAAIEAIVEKTGDMRFAEENMRNIAATISATGAAGRDIGDMMAEFQKMGITGPKEVLKAIDVLNVQGKEGAFTLENLAALGPRVISAYQRSGRGGVEALREMGAALQMIRQGTGSSEMAASAFEATMNTITDPQKIKQLEKLGISLFDPKKAAEGKKVWRPINELMTEIIQKTKGDATKLGLVFDAEAIRAFNSAAAEFQRSGTLSSLDRYYKVQADGAQTIEDSQRAAKTYAGAMNSLSAAGMQFANSNLAGPIQDLADALNSVEPGTVQRWLSIGKNMILLTGGLIALQKIKGLFNTKSAAGAAGGGGGGAPIPVYVVNGPAAGGGMPGAGPAGGGSRMAQLAGGAQGVLFAGAAGYAAGSAVYNTALSGDDGHNNAGGQFIGRNIARVLSLFGNDAAAEGLAGERYSQQVTERNKMEGELRIKIEGPGRVQEMSGSNMKLTAETGRTMGG